MRPSDEHADTDGTYDHVVVGAGLSGLAYAWRRQQAGRRVLVLPAPNAGASTTPVLVEGTAPHLERLLEVLPSAAPLETPTCAPLLCWTPAGLRPASSSALRRILRRPGSLASEVRARLFDENERPQAPLQLRVLAGGVRGLCRTLAGALGSSVQAERAVARVCPRLEEGGAAWVETAEGTVRAHEVALDLPAFEQARLLARDEPHRADVLRAVPNADVTTVMLELEGARLPPIAGFVRGQEAHGRVRTRTRSAVFLSNLVPSGSGTPRVEARLEAPEISDLEDEMLGRIALVDLGRALNRTVRGRLVETRHLRCVRPQPGHRRRMAELASDLVGRGVRLLGDASLGSEIDRLAAAGVPVPGPLPHGVTLA